MVSIVEAWHTGLDPCPERNTEAVACAPMTTLHGPCAVGATGEVDVQLPVE
jgi:hypothetical protein